MQLLAAGYEYDVFREESAAPIPVARPPKRVAADEVRSTKKILADSPVSVYDAFTLDWTDGSILKINRDKCGLLFGESSCVSIHTMDRVELLVLGSGEDQNGDAAGAMEKRFLDTPGLERKRVFSERGGTLETPGLERKRVFSERGGIRVGQEEHQRALTALVIVRDRFVVRRSPQTTIEKIEGEGFEAETLAKLRAFVPSWDEHYEKSKGLRIGTKIWDRVQGRLGKVVSNELGLGVEPVTVVEFPIGFPLLGGQMRVESVEISLLEFWNPGVVPDVDRKYEITFEEGDAVKTTEMLDVKAVDVEEAEGAGKEVPLPSKGKGIQKLQAKIMPGGMFLEGVVRTSYVPDNEMLKIFWSHAELTQELQLLILPSNNQF